MVLWRNEGNCLRIRALSATRKDWLAFACTQGNIEKQKRQISTSVRFWESINQKALVLRFFVLFCFLFLISVLLWPGIFISFLLLAFSNHKKFSFLLYDMDLIVCVNRFPLFLVWFFVAIFLSLCVELLGLVKSVHPGNWNNWN